MRPELPGALASLGLKLVPEWLAACDAHLRAALAGYDRLSLEKQVEAVYCQFLESDMNLAGAGCLPSDVEARTQLRARRSALTRPPGQTREKEQLPGRYVLQMDEVVNIHAPESSRYQDGRPANATFLLALTDGVQRVSGLEYASLPTLFAQTPPGSKVVLTHPHLLHGQLMLTPDCFTLLGGRCERLCAARAKAVAAWNAPPEQAALASARARARSRATGQPAVVPTRYEAACAAAWAGDAPAAAPAAAPAPAAAAAAAAPGRGDTRDNAISMDEDEVPIMQRFGGSHPTPAHPAPAQPPRVAAPPLPQPAQPAGPRRPPPWPALQGSPFTYLTALPHLPMPASREFTVHAHIISMVRFAVDRYELRVMLDDGSALRAALVQPSLVQSNFGGRSPEELKAVLGGTKGPAEMAEAKAEVTRFTALLGPAGGAGAVKVRVGGEGEEPLTMLSLPFGPGVDDGEVGRLRALLARYERNGRRTGVA